MTRVHVAASGCYDIIIERGILSRVGAESAGLLRSEKAVIVSGERVFPLWGETLRASLESAGFEVLCYIHETGETAKSLESYGALLNFLSEKQVHRTDCLFALGGGVTGDLTGFAAATYQRGMPFIQIPTTLLAMVDSSVGGKTAVNLPSAKNQVGCFYQPRAVFCDPEVLKTLPQEEYRCGCAEVIKYGVLGDGDFFSMLSERDFRGDEEPVIARCVEMKRDIVEADEFDLGQRRLLNLGHTLGHAAEKCSGFALPHGDAVAMGLAAVMRQAAARGICSSADCERVIETLKKYGLPTELAFGKKELFEACRADKKIANGKMHLIVPEKPGACRIIAMDTEELRSWI
ncbi:MAG: 3-dehydroquinate synthase [Oscillospiraceae bacterium]|nr:3-dehydroquinate synthase [Oscillospiraceae bacterium]